jgi:hypothetical protein
MLALPPTRHEPRVASRPWSRVLAVAFGITALFHAAAIGSPSLAPGSSAYRHAVFVGIDAAVAVGLLLRPPWFVPAFGVLTAQQLYSHGLDLWGVWTRTGHIDWMSVAVLAIMPLTMATLVMGDRRARAQAHGAGLPGNGVGVD